MAVRNTGHGPWTTPADIIGAVRRRWERGDFLTALATDRIWPALITTVLWIDANASPHTYLRQIDVPGVDTKFVEEHRTILASLLDHHLPDGRIDRTRPPSDFAGRYRFRRKPSYVRLRWLDPA